MASMRLTATWRNSSRVLTEFSPRLCNEVQRGREILRATQLAQPRLRSARLALTNSPSAMRTASAQVSSGRTEPRCRVGFRIGEQIGDACLGGALESILALSDESLQSSRAFGYGRGIVVRLSRAAARLRLATKSEGFVEGCDRRCVAWAPGQEGRLRGIGGLAGGHLVGNGLGIALLLGLDGARIALARSPHRCAVTRSMASRSYRAPPAARETDTCGRETTSQHPAPRASNYAALDEGRRVDAPLSGAMWTSTAQRRTQREPDLRVRQSSCGGAWLAAIGGCGFAKLNDRTASVVPTAPLGRAFLRLMHPQMLRHATAP